MRDSGEIGRDVGREERCKLLRQGSEGGGCIRREQWRKVSRHSCRVERMMIYMSAHLLRLERRMRPEELQT